MSSPPTGVRFSVHRDVPECCRETIAHFAGIDIYKGGGEPGDTITCGCGNTLVYDWRGWRVARG